MKVILCEDNKQLLQKLTTYIQNYAMIEENSIEVVLQCSNPMELLSYIQSNKADCYFLDIDLGSEINGMDLAKQIRQVDPIASIIFVTTHSEMLHLTFAYRVEALDFIIKDDFSELKPNVINALKTAYDKYEKIGNHVSTRYYQIKIGEFVKNIDLQHLLYFKAADTAHKINLYTLHGQFEFYQSLNEIENSDDSFFRCHKSYIINLKNIKEVNLKTKNILMKNGVQCPLSFRKIKVLKEHLKSIGFTNISQT